MTWGLRLVVMSEVTVCGGLAHDPGPCLVVMSEVTVCGGLAHHLGPCLGW
jgi:hypothetical protein